MRAIAWIGLVVGVGALQACEGAGISGRQEAEEPAPQEQVEVENDGDPVPTSAEPTEESAPPAAAAPNKPRPKDKPTPGPARPTLPCRNDFTCQRALPTTACEVAQCVRGTCVVLQAAEGADCFTGDKCEVNGRCESGYCKGTPLDCDDGNPCTADRCKSKVGCLSIPASFACDDGNPCTKGDTCQGGKCKGGEPVVCSDGDPCNGQESCSAEAGGCIAGEAPSCGDGQVDPACGETCDDGGTAPHDGCSPECTVETSLCATAADCDDGDTCTIDVCSPFTGCGHIAKVGAICSDGDPCTGDDVCGSDGCEPGAPVVCNDGVACTSDACEPGVGCIHTPNGSVCAGGGACAVAVCDKLAGCIVAPIVDETECDDGNACTAATTCTAGECTQGTPVSCDDGNPCTADSCKPDKGCVFAPLNGNSCNDGDACTVADACTDGVCKGGYETQSSGCGAPAEAVCAISGDAGDLVKCPIAVVGASATAPFATALQFTLEFDAQSAALVQFFDTLCFGAAGCFELPVGGSGAGTMALSTGHSLVMAPMTVGGWNGVACETSATCDGATCADGVCQGSGGFGAVLFINFANPNQPMSTAYLQGGQVMGGDANVIVAHFTLLRDIPATEPEFLLAGSIQGAGPDSTNASFFVQGYRIVSK